MKLRRPAPGSLRYFEEVWRSADLSECIQNLAKLSYENERLRKRVSDLEEIVGGMHEHLEKLLINQKQLEASINLLVYRMRTMNAHEGLLRWPGFSVKMSKPN